MISIIFVMLCCFAALLCCCFAALLLCCFTAVLLCGHRSKSFSVGVLWLTALVFTGLNFLKLSCGQGCCFLNWWSGGSSCVPWASKHFLIVILFAGHRTHSKISCWNHGFRFCNSNFCFHLAHVKITLELDSGLVLGPMVHRIPNIFRLLYFI